MSDLVRLGDVCRIQNGFAFDSARFTSAGGMPLIRIRDISKGACSVFYDGPFDKAYVVHRGDVLVGMDGEFNAAQWTGDPALLNQRVCRLIPDSNALDATYLLHRIKQDLKAIEETTASTTVKHLSSKQIAALRWMLPPLKKQCRIAAQLNAQLAEVQSAGQAALVQREGAEALQAALYREAFAEVVPVAVPPTFDDPPPGWQWRKLTEMARLESGHTPSRSRPDWWGGDVSWISLTEIRALDGRWVESTQLRTNVSGIANSAARILPRGTVCYSRTASVGFVTIMAKPMATSQDFANWVCGDALDPEFLMYALIRARRELRDLATGATHKTIYMPTLESFHICAPDVDTQRRIVRDLKQRLAEASKLRAALAAQQAELTKLPQRLLVQAFEN